MDSVDSAYLVLHLDIGSGLDRLIQLGQVFLSDRFQQVPVDYGARIHCQRHCCVTVVNGQVNRCFAILVRGRAGMVRAGLVGGVWRGSRDEGEGGHTAMSYTQSASHTVTGYSTT